MVAFDNYEGPIVRKEMCRADFDAYNATRWAAFAARARPVHQGTDKAPVVDRFAARAQASALLSERQMLRSLLASRPESQRGALRDRLTEIAAALGRQARIAAGVEAEYQTVAAQAEVALRAYLKAAEDEDDHRVGTLAYQTAHAVTQQLDAAHDQLLFRQAELDALARAQIPGAEESADDDDEL